MRRRFSHTNHAAVTIAVHTGVAQLAEQRSPKPQAAGSSPAARARNIHGVMRRNQDQT